MRTGYRETFSVMLMAGCLLFLTAINFFLYPVNDNSDTAGQFANAPNRSEECPVSIPTEEKSAESGFSIMEELLHVHHLITELNALNKLFQHIVAEADKLQIVHSELFTPPPES